MWTSYVHSIDLIFPRGRDIYIKLGKKASVSRIKIKLCNPTQKNKNLCILNGCHTWMKKTSNFILHLKIHLITLLNSFSINVPLLYPLKTSENLRFERFWYHLYKLKNEKNTNEVVFCRLKPATLRKVTLLYGRFPRFFKFCTWYQTAESITYVKVLEKVNDRLSKGTACYQF